MSYLNPVTRQLHLNIAYYGPARSGKTTSLRRVYAGANQLQRSAWFEVAEPFPLVGFFWASPLLRIDGAEACMHLSAVPGQVFLDDGRKQLLCNVDGIVFVADADPARYDANIESAENLQAHLATQRRALADLPIVVQVNKCDLFAGEMDLPGMDGAPRVQTAAVSGHGVMDALKTVYKQIARSYQTGRAKPAPMKLLKMPEDPLQLWRLFRTGIGNA